jgi:uncharacterized protein with HEPN domain
MWRDDATLLDILRAARLALQFRGQLDRTSFLNDLKTQAAVLHELLVLGEAAKRLHGYDNVDLDLVWKTVDEDLPALVTRLEGLAPRQDS